MYLAQCSDQFTNMVFVIQEIVDASRQSPTTVHQYWMLHTTASSLGFAQDTRLLVILVIGTVRQWWSPCLLVINLREHTFRLTSDGKHTDTGKAEKDLHSKILQGGPTKRGEDDIGQFLRIVVGWDLFCTLCVVTTLSLPWTNVADVTFTLTLEICHKTLFNVTSSTDLCVVRRHWCVTLDNVTLLIAQGVNLRRNQIACNIK